jgi:crotonobetainyl-CoA:carnitine CoA-transferase CaiB-like acyl-CoA transferase
MSKVFEGLKIVELASVLAGPAVGMFFAELGAEVVKIENKLSDGDVTRTWRLSSESGEDSRSAYYCSVNYGKEVLMLNLKDSSDRIKLDELLKDADIVLSNFRASVAEKLMLTYAQVKSVNPTVIFAELKGYPNSDRPAYDVVLQAETGFMHMTGEAGRVPVKMPVALIDILAAHQLKEGILVALIQKLKTGKGSLVKVNLFDSALASLANQATNWLVAKHIPQAMGSAHPNIAPYGDVFEAKDGRYFVLAVGSDAHFKALCSCIGKSEMASNSLFRTNQDRLKNRSALLDLLAESFKDKSAFEWMELLEKNNVPAGLIRNMKELFELDIASEKILQFSDNIDLKAVKSVAFEIY